MLDNRGPHQEPAVWAGLFLSLFITGLMWLGDHDYDVSTILAIVSPLAAQFGVRRKVTPTSE